MAPREMTINQIKSSDNNFGANHTIKVNGFKDKKGKSKLDLILERLDKIEDFIVEQKKFNQYVISQFEKHSWTK